LGYPWSHGDILTYNDLNAAIGLAQPLATAVTSVAGRIGNVTLAVADVSGAAPLASPALTGTPTAPTAATATNTTQIATTAYVQANLAPTALLAALNALIATLPTSLPGTSGQLWNNGGMLSVS
jgi:hypothetical protein